jgi:hypothetical protein
MARTRRDFLIGAARSAGGVAAAEWPRASRGQAGTITVAHSVSTFVCGQHLVAKEKQYFENISLPNCIVPGDPWEATEKGRDSVILFATDTRCS